MAAPRLLLLLTVSLHLQPLHTKYLLVQTLDIFGAIKRSGLAYFYYPAKKWKNMVKNDCSVNITNPCTLGSPYPSHKILIQCKVWSCGSMTWGKDLMHCSFWRPKAAPYNCLFSISTAESSTGNGNDYGDYCVNNGGGRGPMRDNDIRCGGTADLRCTGGCLR